MARLNTIEYAAEFLRGWPVAEPTAEMNYQSGATATSNGDLVYLDTNGQLVPTTAATQDFGVVVRGDNDRIGTTAGYGGTTPTNIVLFSNYVIRTTNYTHAGTPAAGDYAHCNATGAWLLDTTAPGVGEKFGRVLEYNANSVDETGAAAPSVVIHVG